jgi:hypothetical protein
MLNNHNLLNSGSLATICFALVAGFSTVFAAVGPAIA